MFFSHVEIPSLPRQRDFEMFITADLRGIENPQEVIAVAYLRNIESYKEFKRGQFEDISRALLLVN